jgi:hypothetical protein
MMLILTRFSPVRTRKRLSHGFGIAAIVCALLWLISLVTLPRLGQDRFGSGFRAGS